jgi:hypothetical protein
MICTKSSVQELSGKTLQADGPMRSGSNSLNQDGDHKLFWFIPEPGGRQSRWTLGSRLLPGGRHNYRYHTTVDSSGGKVSQWAPCCNRTANTNHVDFLRTLANLLGSVIGLCTPQNQSRHMDHTDHNILVRRLHASPHSCFVHLSFPSSSTHPFSSSQCYNCRFISHICLILSSLVSLFRTDPVR